MAEITNTRLQEALLSDLIRQIEEGEAHPAVLNAAINYLKAFAKTTEDDTELHLKSKRLSELTERMPFKRH